MKVALGTKLTDLDGKDIVIDDAGKPATLRYIIVTALMGVYESEKDLPGADKLKRFLLAQRIHKSEGDANLSTEEVVEIKKLVSLAFPSPLVVGQVFEILEK